MIRPALIAAVLPVLLLAGCASSPKEYESPRQLVDAFKSAGGSCSSSFAVPEEMVSPGAHALACKPSIDFMVVFDSASERNRYVAEEAGIKGQQIVSGTRWVAVGKDVAQYAGALGGKVVAKG